MVVKAEEENVGLLPREPLRHRLVALEQRRPVGIGLPALVERHPDCRHVRGADAADDPRHMRMVLEAADSIRTRRVILESCYLPRWYSRTSTLIVPRTSLV